MDDILELSYRTPQKLLEFSKEPLYFKAVCWMCRAKFDEDKPVWMARVGASKLYYCSELCKNNHINLKSEWKP